VSTACSSTTDAIGHAFDFIRNSSCDRVIAGGADILTEPILGGFNLLYSLSNGNPRPFDKDRDGFVIGEGAGLIYMETLESARERGARIYAEVLGYGLSNTAYHLTATSEDGVGEALSILRALRDANLSPEDVDYINTHGTATLHNDATEILAISSVFGESTERIKINSTKASIGHCMGAAGIMEAISTVLSLQHQEIPPTINTAGNIEGLKMKLVTKGVCKTSIKYAISESFGFGGACSCIVFGKDVK
jgi:3-oxoacyl-[acyl-carrier-protein] synthase II